MNSLLTLFLKELRELFRDRKTLFGIVVVPLILYPLMGAGINVSRSSAEQAAAKTTIAVMNNDRSPAAQNLTQFLTLTAKVKLLQYQSLEEALPTLNDGNYSALVVIPFGYGQSLSQGLQARLRVYALFKDLSLTEVSRGVATNVLLIAYRNALVVERIQRLLASSPYQAMNATSILNPVQVNYSSVFRGKAVEVDPTQLLGVVISQSTFPLIIMVMLILAMQIAATSIALEKEEKTLETLLTLPIGRLTILTGKLAGSVALAGISVIAYLVGFSYYLGSVTGAGLSQIPQADLLALGLSPSPSMYTLMGFIIFVTVVSALALAVSIAIFADNVRSAQSLVGILFIPIMMPAFILMFADISILPSHIQWVLYIFPYTHTLLGIKAIFLGDVPVILRSTAYICTFTAVLLYAAAKIFTTERVITGRLFARRFRGRD